MGEYEINRHVAEQFQALPLIRLNIVGFRLHGCSGPPDASDAKDGDGLLPSLKGIGNTRFQTPEPQIRIDRKIGVRKSVLAGIQPAMILMIATHKEEITSEFFHERGNLWVFRCEEVQKAEPGRISCAMAPGGPIESCPVRKDAQVTDLQDQVELLPGFLLPADTELEGQQDVPVKIAKHRDIHSSDAFYEQD